MMARLLIALAAVAWQAATAGAPTCTFTITESAFGTVDVIAGGAVDTAATLSVNCTGALISAVRICPSIGSGSGGATANARPMAGPGAASLNYQLYQDAARSVVWGSYNWGFAATPPTIDLPLSLG